MPLFWLQKWIQLGHISQVANFCLSSHNVWWSGCNSKISIFPKLKRVLYGAAMLDDIVCLLKFLNYSFFTKIMTRKPNIGNLTDMTELYPFLESKKWHLLFKGILWSRDLLVKTINRRGVKSARVGVERGEVLLVCTFDPICLVLMLLRHDLW